MPRQIPVAPRPRALVILEGGSLYPSGVVRALIYREHFERSGWEVVYRNRRFPFLAALVHKPPKFLSPLTTKGIGRLISYALMEGAALLFEPFLVAKARRCDVVYLAKVKSLRLIRKLKARAKPPVVLDFTDSAWLHEFTGEHFDDMLRLADAVTTDNDYTARYVRRFNERCTVVPDAPQVEAFDERRSVLRRKASDDHVALGWIGTPGAAYNLYLIWPVLERLFVKHPNIRLRLIGVGHDERLLPPFERVRFSIRPTYDQASMIEELLAVDIGLFPMFDVEASVVRGVLKACVYMAGEAAVVASPVGQTVDVIRDGENGFLAAGGAEWEEKLSALIDSAPLRRKLTAAGLETVRSSFTIGASFSILDGVLRRQLDGTR